MLRRREQIAPLSREETKVARLRRIVRLVTCARWHNVRLRNGFTRRANELTMKSEVTAAESVQHASMPPTCAEVSPPAGPCAGADDNESVAKHLFKLSRDVILSLDRAGNILCINQRGVQLSGYSETELRGANIAERLLLIPTTLPTQDARLRTKLWLWKAGGYLLATTQMLPATNLAAIQLRLRPAYC